MQGQKQELSLPLLIKVLFQIFLLNEAHLSRTLVSRVSHRKLSVTAGKYCIVISPHFKYDVITLIFTDRVNKAQIPQLHNQVFQARCMFAQC